MKKLAKRIRWAKTYDGDWVLRLAFSGLYLKAWKVDKDAAENANKWSGFGQATHYFDLTSKLSFDLNEYFGTADEAKKELLRKAKIALKEYAQQFAKYIKEESRLIQERIGEKI